MPDIETTLSTWRAAAERALTAQDELLAAWRKSDREQLARECTADHIDLLRQLIVRRIYPINAFEVLARVNRAAAIDMLLSRYVGAGVCADAKFGGYLFELRSMLEDLVECRGEAALRELVTHPEFDQQKLDDPRVVTAISDALEIEESAVAKWLEGA